jgi:hypothetical protein
MAWHANLDTRATIPRPTPTKESYPRRQTPSTSLILPTKLCKTLTEAHPERYREQCILTLELASVTYAKNVIYFLCYLACVSAKRDRLGKAFQRQKVHDPVYL